MIWHKKSREIWLKDGDMNSKFYHAFAKICHRRNNIERIQLQDNKWISSHELIGEYFVHSFKDLFGSTLIPLDLDYIIQPVTS